MATPLEKARQQPESMKAKILTSARKLFGEYGFHGTTTRMIASDVGIDISTLYYHWGEKGDLYEAVIVDMNDGIRAKLTQVEQIIKGRPLAERIEIAVDELVDYLFEHSELSNLAIFSYFTKNRHNSSVDERIPEFISDIAYSMDLSTKRGNASPFAKMKVLSIMNAIHNYVSGEAFFLPMLGITREEYICLTKETVKFFTLSNFVDG
ncbi:MAG: TetR family transcriptional regulator [Desulfobacterales bacterium RIFOXYA12_FULL_46_15]|nr:MAG: TetR family transcriptional regulator [Desulfobacula sp. GWF2_41_7]OGR24956.1 MAG: TetR family transcriptional regulator [Desulfobacterales bacterium RIFOXYA12_FULL_46_15]